VPTVKIPPVLRAHVGGEQSVEAAGATVGEVLQALTAKHEGLQTQLFDDAGQLNRFVNIYLNDEDVRLLDGLDTAASDLDTVVILPAMAGGL
jgi:molybdopterin converting factor small subunit